jgi:phage tail sheath protein FI
MPQYFAPGVYVEEIDAGPQPIEGVSTSITGAVGVTLQGPTSGKPVLVTSFAEFQNTFGGFLPPPPPALQNRWALDARDGGDPFKFPLSVKGFFDNGGQQLYVKRVFSSAARAAAAAFGQGLVADITQDANASANSVKLSHLIDIVVGKSLRFWAAGVPIPGNPFTVVSYNSSLNTVTLNNPLGFALRAGRDFVVIETRQPGNPNAPIPALNTTLNFTAKALGDWGNSISVRVAPMVGGTFTILPDPNAGGNSAITQLSQPATAGTVTIRVRSTSGFGPNDHARIAGQEYSLSNITGATIRISAGLAAALRSGTDVTRPAAPAVPNLTAQLSQAEVAGATTIHLQNNPGFGVGDRVVIAGQQYTVANPTPNTIDIAPALAAGAPIGTTVMRPMIAAVPSFATQLSRDALAAAQTLEVLDASGFTAGDSVQIAGQNVTLANVTSATVDVTPVPAPPALPAGLQTDLPGGASVTRLRRAAAVNATTIHVSGALQIYENAILQLDNGIQKDAVIVQPGGVVGEVLTFLPALTNAYFEGHKLRVIEAEVDTQNTVNGVVVASETMQNLRLHDDQTTNFIVTAVNLQSNLVNVAIAPAAAGGGYSDTDLTLFPTSPGSEWVPLTGGADNLDQLTVEDFVGVDLGFGRRTGIQALEDITNISICIAPGMWSETIQSTLINHCERLVYRFAILDPPDGLTIDQIIAFREPLDTKFAALYYPWVEVLDPLQVRNVNLAPSGHMAGIFAQTDNDRGVWKAPANVEIGLITKIAQDVNKREQGVLNPIGINALRFFPERGNRVWGARTLSSLSSWKYINVKRLFIYVEASIDVGTQWVVFEPNDEPLWARVRQTITDFLETTWRSGALQGTTAAQAFFVKCDRTTMTQDDIDNGRLICVIGIAPVKPAEFVIFRIQQFTQATATA